MKKVVLVLTLLILTTSLFAKNTQSKQLKESEEVFLLKDIYIDKSFTTFDNDKKQDKYLVSALGNEIGMDSKLNQFIYFIRVKSTNCSLYEEKFVTKQELSTNVIIVNGKPVGFIYEHKKQNLEHDGTAFSPKTETGAKYIRNELTNKKNTYFKNINNETMFIINSTDYNNAKTQLTNKCKKFNKLIKEAL